MKTRQKDGPPSAPVWAATESRLEAELYQHSRIGWAAYVYLKYLALEPKSEQRDQIVRLVWETLPADTQDRIRKIRSARSEAE